MSYRVRASGPFRTPGTSRFRKSSFDLAANGVETGPVPICRTFNGATADQVLLISRGRSWALRERRVSGARLGLCDSCRNGHSPISGNLTAAVETRRCLKQALPRLRSHHFLMSQTLTRLDRLAYPMICLSAVTSAAEWSCAAAMSIRSAGSPCIFFSSRVLWIRIGRSSGR